MSLLWMYGANKNVANVDIQGQYEGRCGGRVGPIRRSLL